MHELKNKHGGQAAWIIGKGPSLQYLKCDDIGEGVIITINEAIVPVESLGLSNPVYSLQKDGGSKRKYPYDILEPDCEFSGQCNGDCLNMVRPQTATLLLHERESKYCFPDYPDRHIFDWERLGLAHNVFSLHFALRIAQYMGCSKFIFVCCDSHARGDMTTYVPGNGTGPSDYKYFNQRLLLAPVIKDLAVEWITPKACAIPTVMFGAMVNEPKRLDLVLRKSEIGAVPCYVVHNPDSAAKGLNKLLDIIENKGADVAVLTHQDMYYRLAWLSKMQAQLALLPDNWVIAGIVGKDMEGELCGHFHDMSTPLWIHGDQELPAECSCIDECCILVNLKSGFRFDEDMEGFDLYGSYAVARAKELGTAWIIDAWAEHYCGRFYRGWEPDDKFKAAWKWLYNRFPGQYLDSTVLAGKGVKPPGFIGLQKAARKSFEEIMRTNWGSLR